MFSDLFFLQNSAIPAQDILVYFGHRQAPLTERDWNDLRGQGVSAVVTNPLATSTPHAPLFCHKKDKMAEHILPYQTDGCQNILNDQWLQRYTTDYHRRVNYWTDFVTQNNVKIHVTWFKYNPDYCAKMDALRKTGGIGIVYQRSCEFLLTPHWLFTMADVFFGFSKLGVDGQDRNSIIPYYVITGFLGDSKFGLLKKQANAVRDRLKNNGAKRITAYFDEHVKNHPRWNLSYHETLEQYSFLLNKVLENPWFGLILKPKVPATLRDRLGSVSGLLHQAEKTGRCFVFEEGEPQGSYPPAAASLGADIAIHGHLVAATAGIESALAGTPTLLVDSENTNNSPLYNLLGKDRVIFKDMPSLWQACMEHWDSPGGIPGFADWSQAFNELDPFRDGRAAERMGTYLKWLIEGFKAKLPRETVLADAAERYSEIWGKDKILAIN